MKSVHLFDPPVCFNSLSLDIRFGRNISQSCFYHGGDEFGSSSFVMSSLSRDQKGLVGPSA